MKITILLAILFPFSLGMFSQENEYLDIMKNTIRLINKSDNIKSLQNAANIFEMIANTKNTEWLPYYYSAYAYVQ